MLVIISFLFVSYFIILIVTQFLFFIDILIATATTIATATEVLRSSQGCRHKRLGLVHVPVRHRPIVCRVYF